LTRLINISPIKLLSYENDRPLHLKIDNSFIGKSDDFLLIIDN
jgi:hypothetical protein